MQNRDGVQRHNVEQKKADTKEHILYYSVQEQATLIYGHRSLDSGYSWRGAILARKEHRNYLGHWKCSGAHGWVHMQQFMEIKLKVGTLMTVRKVIWQTTNIPGLKLWHPSSAVGFAFRRVLCVP